MPLQKNEGLKTTDYLNEAESFRKQFQNPDKSGSLKKSLTIEEIVKKAEFHQIKFNDLPQEVRNFFEKNVAVLGNPVGYDKKIKTNSVVMASANNDVVYLIVQNEKKEISWSRLKKCSNGYSLHAINHDTSLDEAINIIGFFEILNKNDPENYPASEQNNHIILTTNPKGARSEVMKMLET